MAQALQESQWKKVLKDNASFDDPGLADALKGFAKSEGKEVDERLEALEEVVATAEKARKASVKAKHKEVTAYLDDVLGEAKQEKQRLEQDDEEAVGLLDDEKAYGAYLKKSLMRLTKGPLYFAAALGKKPAQHRILFHKSQDGKKLLATLKEATELKKFAWGLAGGHAEEKSTATLGLEGPQIGGLKKKLEGLLKYFKPLPFDTILLMVDGETVEDLADPDDDTSTTESTAEPKVPPPPGSNSNHPLMVRLNGLAPRIKDFAAKADEAGKSAGGDLEAKKAALAPKNQLLTLIRDCKGLIGKDDKRAETMLAEIEKILAAPKSNIPRPPPMPGTNSDNGILVRLNALTPQIKEFAAAADELGKKVGADLEAKKAALAPKNRLLTLIREIKSLIGKNDKQAEVLMAEIREILQLEPEDLPPTDDEEDVDDKDADDEDTDDEDTDDEDTDDEDADDEDADDEGDGDDENTDDEDGDDEESKESPSLADSLANWKVERRAVVDKLKSLKKQIASSEPPGFKETLKQIRAVRKQLKHKPKTLKKVNEMERYLKEDLAFEEISKLVEGLRDPLLAATERVKAAL